MAVRVLDYVTCWDIFTWEFVGGVRYKQAGFTHGTIPHHHAFNRLHSKFRLQTLKTKSHFVVSLKKYIFVRQRYYAV